MSLLDHLSESLIPKDFSSISRAVETIALIYHQNVKTFNERNCREMKEKIDELIKTFDKASSSQSNEFSTPQPTQMPPTDSIKQTPLVLHAPPTTPASTTMLQQHQGNAEPRFSREERTFLVFQFRFRCNSTVKRRICRWRRSCATVPSSLRNSFRRRSNAPTTTNGNHREHRNEERTEKHVRRSRPLLPSRPDRAFSLQVKRVIRPASDRCAAAILNA